MVHRRAHPHCFACGEEAAGGLGLCFRVTPEGVVAADWCCPPAGRSYDGILHGGLIATLLDSAMVHALFARNIVARTADLHVRFHHPVQTGGPVTVAASLRAHCGPLYCLEAEVRQAGVVCASAQAKFMATDT
jgi:acyl-coenzyme A thioesterase PaaI-like protein